MVQKTCDVFKNKGPWLDFLNKTSVVVEKGTSSVFEALPVAVCRKALARTSAYEDVDLSLVGGTVKKANIVVPMFFGKVRI